MTEVFAIVEGQTEEAFVNELLGPHLAGLGILITPLLTGTRKQRRAERGGNRVRYAAVRDDVMRVLKEHAARDPRITTMLDLFRLPTDYPGYTDAQQTPDPYERVGLIEAALAVDLADWRVVPYIQLHEFEALLLCDLDHMASRYPENSQAVAALAGDVAAYSTPELVNDGPETAPSKRIAKAIGGYEKVLAGAALAKRIGLPVMRRACPHFDQWLGKLEALAQ